MAKPQVATEPAFKPVHGTIMHVEFSSPDLRKSGAFYSALFKDPDGNTFCVSSR